MTGFSCGLSDLHPYECGGTKEGCIHCLLTVTGEHNPDTCALCNDFLKDEFMDSEDDVIN